MKKLIDRGKRNIGKRSKTLSEVKLVENTSRNISCEFMRKSLK